MATMAENIIVVGAENQPPMLEKGMYDSWKSRILLYIEGRRMEKCLAGYYRRVIEGFLKIDKPITKLTQKTVKFDLGEKEEAAFQVLKQKLCSAPILALPEGSEDFVVYCDASHKWLGTVLKQIEKVISYASRLLKVHEKNYTTTIWSLELKANVVADALSRKERVKPLRVRALMMTIDLNLPSQILNAQVDALKDENVNEESLNEMNKKFESRTYGTHYEIQIDDKLYFVKEPVEIIDRRDKRLKQIRIPMVKVCGNSRRGPEFTWEREDQIRKKYPHLFTDPVPSLNATT
nr:putative reverse transcriptase domain-containing protein [Tanacetum cinerariifolium]